MVERRAVVLNGGELQELPTGDTLLGVEAAGFRRPEVRSSSSATTTGSSLVTTLPTGSLAGDLCVIFVSGGWTPSVPAGWSEIIQNTGTNINYGCYAKTLEASDISTGSVTVSLAGSFDAVSTAVTYVGSYPIELDVIDQHSATGAGSETIESIESDRASSILLFGGNRATSSNVTCDLGTSLQAPAITNLCANLLEYAPANDAAYIATMTYAVSGTGHVEARVRVLPRTFIGATIEHTDSVASYSAGDYQFSGGVYDTADHATVDIVITIPDTITSLQPFVVERGGAANVTFLAGGTTVINSPGSLLSIGTQYSAVTVVPKGSNVYTLVGDLA